MFQNHLQAEFSGDHRLNEMAHYHLNTGGKCLRGRLAIAEAEEVGLSFDKALIWGMACELLHNATLIHDDIQDNDPIRRGQPSLWKKYGVAQAINTGDLFIFKAFNLASQLGNIQLPSTLAEISEKLVRGQADELETIKATDQGCYWDAYIQMSSQKTGTLFQLPILGIHILADLPLDSPELDAWMDLGVSYQIMDDLRDWLGLKQMGQKQKDFVEKRVNALVAFLSRSEKHQSLLRDYLHVVVGTDEQKQIINEVNQLIASQNLVEELEGFAKQKLADFRKKASGKTQTLIFEYLNSAVDKGVKNAEQNI